jgi:predicted metal-binding transcription factor (methanogenesis marker protein 9)
LQTFVNINTRETWCWGSLMLCCRLVLAYDATKSGMEAFDDQITEFLKYVKNATNTVLRDSLSDPSGSHSAEDYGTVATNFREGWGAIGDPLLFEAIPIKHFFQVCLLSASACQHCF